MIKFDFESKGSLVRIVKILLTLGLALSAACQANQEKPHIKETPSHYISMSDFDALPPGICTGPPSTKTLNIDRINHTVEGSIFPQIGPTLNHDDLLVFNIWFSPNQRCLISEAAHVPHPRKDTLRLWDLKTGQAIGEPMVHGGNIYGAAFSKDGSRFLSWGEDGFLRQWDSRSAMQLGQVMNHNGLIRAAKFNKDETRILSHSTWDRSARLWDANSGRQIGRTMKHNSTMNQSSYVSGATFNQDETKILTWTWGEAKLWDAKTGKRLYKFTKDKTNSRSIGQAIFVNDDKEVIIVAGSHLKFWSTETGKSLPPRINEYWGGRVNVLPGGNEILIAPNDSFRGAKLFDMKTGQKIGKPLHFNDNISDYEISSNNNKFLVGQRNGKAILREFSTGEDLIPPMVHDTKRFDNPYIYAKFSPDEQLIATSTLTSKPSVTKLWDAETGKQIGETLPGEGEFSASGKMLVTHDDVGNIRLWDISRAYTK